MADPELPYAQVIHRVLGVGADTDADADLLTLVPAGQTVAAPAVLFAKIEDAQVAEWTERFGGAEG